MRSNTEDAAVRLRTDAEDMAIRTWRQQLDNATRVGEAVSASSMRISELQLRAATEANEMVEQARKLLDKATNPLELWRIQSDWFALLTDRSVSYLKEMTQAAAEAQSSLTRVWYEPGSTFPTQANVLPGASKTAMVMMDDAYRRWHDTTMQIWGAATETFPQQRGQREGRANGRAERETAAASKQTRPES